MKRMMMTIWLGLFLAGMSTPAVRAISSLDASDGSPTKVVSVDVDGKTSITGNTSISGEVQIGTGLSVVSTGNEQLIVGGTVLGNSGEWIEQNIGGHRVTMWVNVSSGYLGKGRTGVYGRSSKTDGLGVSALAEKDAAIAVKGEATNTGNITNYGGYFVAKGKTGEAVYGRAEGDGACAVTGRATSTDSDLHYGGYFSANGDGGRGVVAEALAPKGIGVVAKGGLGLLAEATGGGVAGEFVGNVTIRSITDRAVVMELGEGLDYAEGFDVSEQSQRAPGAVLVIDAENPGKLTLSSKAYDTKVAGIVAGAKNLGSGVRLGGSEFDCDVALAGRVYCNVDASEAGVEPGDLLTTSARPGHAMKVQDHARAQGAILGKAMERLEKGNQGQILVLVTLQ